MKSSASSTCVLRSILPLLMVLAFSSAALAAPVNLFFDGPVVSGENKGMLATTAASSGLAILDRDVFTVTGTLDVISQSANGTTIGSVGQPATVTSTWTIQNLLSTSFIGEVWILFATAGNDTHSIGGQNIVTTYSSDEVALTVDNQDSRWAVVRTASGGTNYHYLGFSLGNLLQTPGATATVDVNYYLQNPETYADGADTILALPEIQILMAFQVPEPASGLLLGLGLVALAGRRRSV